MFHVLLETEKNGHPFGPGPRQVLTIGHKVMEIIFSAHTHRHTIIGKRPQATFEFSRGSPFFYIIHCPCFLDYSNDVLKGKCA